jgi:hypothetical protein
MYDQGPERELIRQYTEKHLRSKYPDWNPEELVYSKWEE